MGLLMTIWAGFLFLVLVVYIAFDMKQQMGRNVSAVYKSLERLCHELNHWDAQQALASSIASLKLSGSDKYKKIKRLAWTRHSFPRLSVQIDKNRPKDLTEEDLYLAIKKYSKITSRPHNKIWCDVNNQVKMYMGTRAGLHLLSENGKNTDKSKVITNRKILENIKKKYSFFDEFKMLHDSDLKKICKGEQIDVFYLKELPLLSFFSELKDETGNLSYVITIREELHQAMKEFLLAHELGHWFLHIKSGLAKRMTVGGHYYLHSSNDWSPIESEADVFAISSLYPTSYLADCDLSDNLNAQDILEEFTKEMSEEVQPRLRAVMNSYINKRIENYNKSKENIFPIKLPVNAIEIDSFDYLMSLLRGGETEVYWVKLDTNFCVEDISNTFLKTFGIPKSQVKGKRARDFIVKPSRKKISNLERKMKARKSTFYVTTLQSPVKEREVIRMLVYALPLVHGDEYVGSVGLLIPHNEVFIPEALKEEQYRLC